MTQAVAEALLSAVARVAQGGYSSIARAPMSEAMAGRCAGSDAMAANKDA